MRSNPLHIATLTFAFYLGLSAAAFAEPTGPERAESRSTSADDTGTNSRDRGKAITPLDQSNTAPLLKRTAEIRAAVKEDKALSTYAHNIKIVTTDEGKTYLRGPVASDEEKAKIVQMAEAKSGHGEVVDELEVASSPK